jgi:chromate transporter
MAALAPEPALRQPRSVWELFAVFTRLALQGFGGVLPVAQRELVEQQRWMDKAQFVELLALGQVLPGPNIINVALIFGDRHFGWRGAAAAVAGLLAVPLVIALALALAYQGGRDLPRVAGALRGMGAVAAGLIVGTAVKLSSTLQGNAMGRLACWALVALTFAGVGLMRWPMVWVVLALGAPAMAWAGKRLP